MIISKAERNKLLRTLKSIPEVLTPEDYAILMESCSLLVESMRLSCFGSQLLTGPDAGLSVPIVGVKLSGTQVISSTPLQNWQKDNKELERYRVLLEPSFVRSGDWNDTYVIRYRDPCDPLRALKPRICRCGFFVNHTYVFNENLNIYELQHFAPYALHDDIDSIHIQVGCKAIRGGYGK